MPAEADGSRAVRGAMPGYAAAMTPSETLQNVRRRAAAEAAEYRGDADRPLAGYAATMGTYAGTAALLVAASRVASAEVPERPAWADLALASLATFKLSRLLAKDPVTSPLRAPFTRFRGRTGPSELAEEPREGTIRHSVGELVSCPFCLSQWIATAFVSGLVFAPRATRMAAATFSVVAASDFLQFARAAAEQATGESE
jgi:hypothetical protein